ncbi:N-formylglutamate amidohydrolase [Rhodobacteraceae bacterium KMM 6894]|nr:N-formylglutamate amidohydrolase [Rhodobacteraceae bacterium KMM 6894]
MTAAADGMPVAEVPPFYVTGAERPSRWLLTCDHASNRVPDFVAGGDLGVTPADMARHIAYDIGAAGVTQALSKALDCPAILSDFSRLVIDPNRGENDPTLVMKLYDGTIIPGNRHADEAEVQTRLNRLYRPYHSALAQMSARRDDTVIVSMHSFTPQLRARPPRPWHIGVLYAADARLAQSLLSLLRAEPDLCVGDNQPYGGHLPGDAIARHAIAHQRPNVLIELRSDLIETPDQQHAWAARLAPILTQALAQTGL